jgi:hypothetical protein
MKWLLAFTKGNNIALLGLALVLAVAGGVHADEPRRDALFHIERSKNANIVQYDARVTADGLLDAKEPVVAYWVRHAEEGQVKELSWIQKTFAYGFTATLNDAKDSATLDMAAKLGRSIVVRRNDGDYRALAEINGVASYIDRIYVQSSGKGKSTQVEYIEIHGWSVNGQVPQFERFSP